MAAASPESFRAMEDHGARRCHSTQSGKLADQAGCRPGPPAGSRSQGSDVPHSVARIDFPSGAQSYLIAFGKVGPVRVTCGDGSSTGTTPTWTLCGASVSQVMTPSRNPSGDQRGNMRPIPVSPLSVMSARASMSRMWTSRAGYMLYARRDPSGAHVTQRYSFSDPSIGVIGRRSEP